MEKNKNLTIEETLNLAIKNHQEGKTDIAQNLYNKILEIDPNHSQTLNNIGIIFTNLKNYQKAKECFKKAIEINPNYADAHNNLGIIFKKLKENQKAKECYEKAIEINPNYADAYYNIGIIFKELGESKKAKECYEKAIAINPNYLSAHYNLGNIYYNLGVGQKAKECYEKAIELNPNYADAHYNLGNIYFNLGVYQKAKECYEKAIEINPNYAKAYNNQGNTYKELGENQKAIGCYEKAIEIDPNYVDAHNQLLKSLYQINNQSILFEKLETITKEGKMNAVIGSICSRSKVKYGFKKKNPFCNDPLDYVFKTNLIEKYDFKNVIVDCVHNILKNNSLSNRAQSLIKNGFQTSGNLFVNEEFNTKEIQRIIHEEIDKYRLKFKDSKEGFINNWPTSYNLKGWLISMKSGGKLKAHMHDMGWLSGSIYVNVPPKLQTDSGNLVVCIDENENEKSIDVVSGSLCLFPSSLLHYTIPFESKEERIVLAFDVVPD
jgi:tetratricopeptide (TPR) repeat protein